MTGSFKWSGTAVLTYDIDSVTRRAMHMVHPGGARPQCPKARCGPVRQLPDPALAAHPAPSFQQRWVRYGSSSTEGSDHATGELYKWSDTVILSYNSDSVTNRVMYQVHPEGAHSQCPKARCRPVRQLSDPALAAHPTPSFPQ